MTKQSIIELDEGKYVINVQALKVETNEPSVMDNYLSTVAIVTKQEDLVYLSVMLKEQQIVTGFQIENQAGELIEAIDQQVNEEAKSRFEMFELDQLQSTLHVRVQYEVEHEGQTIQGNEALRLSFDEETLEKTSDLDIE